MSGKRRATGGSSGDSIVRPGSVSHRATTPQVSLTDPAVTSAPAPVPVPTAPPLGAPVVASDLPPAVPPPPVDPFAGPSPSAQPAVPGTTIAPGVAPDARPGPTSRRELREQRKQASRKRWRVLAIVAAIVVGILAVALLVPTLFMDKRGGGSAAAPTRTQKTLAMVLATAGSPVLAGSLTADDATSGNGSIVLVPSRLIVQGPSPEGVPFGSTARMPSPNAPGFALAQTLGVIVDGTWTLSPAGLASLVDSVGGVPVDVSSDVIVRGPNGSRQVIVPAGTTRLNGAQAAAYATAIPEGADEQVRLAHYDEVMQALLPRLSSDPATLQKQLESLGAQSSVTTGDPWLASYLTSLGDAIDQDNVISQTLPVKPISVGGSVTAYSVDEAATQQLVDQQFAGSKPPGGNSGVRVLVQNGVGSAGLVDSAAIKLGNQGYRFVNGGNANKFGYQKSVVIVPDSSAESTQLGAAIAKTLGLPASSVRVSAEGQNVADVVVILGADYKS